MSDRFTGLLWSRKTPRQKPAEEGKCIKGGTHGGEGTDYTQRENGLSSGQLPSPVTTLCGEHLPDTFIHLKQPCEEGTLDGLPEETPGRDPWGYTPPAEGTATPGRQRGERQYLSVSSSIGGSSNWAPHGRSSLSSGWSRLASSGGGGDMFRTEPSWGQREGLREAARTVDTDKPRHHAETPEEPRKGPFPPGHHHWKETAQWGGSLPAAPPQQQRQKGRSVQG